MTLPILLSVPHAGLGIPPDVEELNLLTREQIAEDGDEGADQLYALERDVDALVTTEIARAFVDMNRAQDDRRKDGVVKTHTCWNVRIYRQPLSEGTVEALLERYHKPYHQQLTARAREGVKVGIDCHTMAVVGPPVGPDPGAERPAICIGNGDGTCPREWLGELALCLGRAFGKEVAINHPFTGGYIIRRHAPELPWIQIEFSRAPFMTMFEKRARLLQAITRWCEGLCW
jgi:N-formylglutamate amidohydrolase